MQHLHVRLAVQLIYLLHKARLHVVLVLVANQYGFDD